MIRSLARLPVAAMACLVAVSAIADETGGYQWRQNETSLTLCHGDKTVWRLVANPKEPKSYFHPLASVDGEELTAFQPADHPWHHGLWWSWKLINGLNYWEEDPKTHVSEGTTELMSATFKPAADFSAHAELSFNYHPPGQAAVMTELRKLTITRPDADGRYRIDWTSEFTAGNAQVDLGRTPLANEENGKPYGGYAGLSARLVLQPDGWSIRTSEGKTGAPASHGQNARWMDFSSPGAGITICDHPANLRDPSPWYVHDSRPMSFFSPAVLFNKPLVLAAGQSLKLRYRILIHSKPMSVEEIETDSHANLLDPASPDRYGTAEIIKAIKLAHFLGVKQVITTEGDPKTDFGHHLTDDQRLFSIREKLHEPIRWAETFGIELLLEPHGILTDTVDGMSRILDALGHEKTVGVNLDTGNSWLGGGDPLQFVKTFGSRIKHVHWKDMPAEWIPKRGTQFGCGMGLIPLGDGVVGIEPIVKELLASGFDGPTTLEIAGEEAVKVFAERLRKWSAS
jgi:inosose dehydratase